MLNEKSRNRREAYRYRGYLIEPQGERKWKLSKGKSFVANGFPDRAEVEERVDENLRIKRWNDRCDRGDAL